MVYWWTFTSDTSTKHEHKGLLIFQPASGNEHLDKLIAASGFSNVRWMDSHCSSYRVLDEEVAAAAASIAWLALRGGWWLSLLPPPQCLESGLSTAATMGWMRLPMPVRGLSLLLPTILASRW